MISIVHVADELIGHRTIFSGKKHRIGFIKLEHVAFTVGKGQKLRVAPASHSFTL